jgi:hypothetical protein
VRSTVEGAAGVSERSQAVGAESHPSQNEGWGTRRQRDAVATAGKMPALRESAYGIAKAMP